MAGSRSAQEVREPGGSEAVAQTSAYRELVARRRRFTAVASGLFYAVLGAFAVLAAWAHDFMATRISGGADGRLPRRTRRLRLRLARRLRLRAHASRRRSRSSPARASTSSSSSR